MRVVAADASPSSTQKGEFKRGTTDAQLAFMTDSKLTATVM